MLETTFKEETETDLFGEQAVLCGGVAELVKSAFETLIEAGYQPESAYFECMHELKLIVDLFYQGGLEYMRFSVSDTAEYGDYTRGPVVIDERVKENMQKILVDIQDGSFAREWIAENDEGRPRFERLRRENAQHPIEKVGKELRGMMSFLKDAGLGGECRKPITLSVNLAVGELINGCYAQEVPEGERLARIEATLRCYLVRQK